MSKFKSDFLNVLDQRGFIHQISDPEGLDALAAKERITGYIGYDATATSIHIGNLVGYEHGPAAVPIYLDVNTLATEHLAVLAMTGSAGVVTSEK